jgi:MmyB-like transcription regulator ligand binding domain
MRCPLSVGELSTRSEAFRTRWAAHDVRLHRTGVKHFRHPAVGRSRSSSTWIPRYPPWEASAGSLGMRRT